MKNSVLHYEISGQGPVVVLVHGYLGSLRYWDGIRAQLEADYTVIAIDLLGFGSSPKPSASRYDYDEHVAWIERTLDACGVQGPVCMVGHSMGSLLCLRYATTHPQRVSGLVLTNPPLFADAKEARQELSSNLFFRASLYWRLHRFICPPMRSKAMQALLRLVMPSIYLGMEKYAFASTPIARFRSLREIIERQQHLNDLHEVAAPVTFIQGNRERPAYIKNLSLAAEKTSVEVVMADTAHHTLLEEPSLIVGAVCAVAS